MEVVALPKEVYFPLLLSDCEFLLHIIHNYLLCLLSNVSNLYFLQRYIIGGIFLCFSPRQESLCKKVEVDVEPAAKEKPTDVETGAASAAGDN